MLKSRLRDLLHDSAASAPAEQADRIREAYALLKQRTGHSKAPGYCAADMQALEAMLSLGAYESAVIALVGGGESFMLSQGAHGTCLASFVLPDGSDEVVSEGSTLALALLCAHISSVLADLDTEPAHYVARSQTAAMRLN